MRWMDDLILLWRRSLPEWAKDAVEPIQQVNFYGPELQLEWERGERKAFGFHFQSRRGVVAVQETLKFRWDERERLSGIAPGGGVIPYDHFSPERVKRNVAVWAVHPHS